MAARSRTTASCAHWRTGSGWTATSASRPGRNRSTRSGSDAVEDEPVSVDDTGSRGSLLRVGVEVRAGVDGRGQVEDLVREVEQLPVLRVLLLHGHPLLAGDHLRFASARFWLIITKVERKIASSDTIIVSSPNGYFSTPNPIQHPNQMTWM